MNQTESGMEGKKHKEKERQKGSERQKSRGGDKVNERP